MERDRVRRSVLRDDSGATIVFVAIAMVVLLSSVALAVDTGMMMTARSESQRAADAAALAGAGALVSSAGDAAEAHQTALEWTGRNLVRGIAVSAVPSDVVIDTEARTVRVTVHNSVARGNPVPTVFARVFGRESVDIVTTATAEAATAGSASCPLPIALPDRWVDDGDGQWDPARDHYVAWPDANGTGYGLDDVGLRVQIKTQASAGESSGGSDRGAGRGGGNGGEGASPGCETASSFDPCDSTPGWDCWYRDRPANEGGGGGADDLGPLIYPGCSDPSVYASVLDEIWTASGVGDKQSLVLGEFKNLVDSDPTAEWDASQGCVTRNGECTFDSPRIRAMPIVRPDRVTGGGANTYAPIHSFAGAFVEKVSCSPTMPHGGGPPGEWNVYVRLMGLTGFDPMAAPVDNAPLLSAIRLIK